MGAEIGNSTQKLHARGPIGAARAVHLQVRRRRRRAGPGVVGRADRHLRRGVQPAARRPPDLCAGGARPARARRGRVRARRRGAAPRDRAGPRRRGSLDDVRARGRPATRFGLSRIEIDREGPPTRWTRCASCATQRAETSCSCSWAATRRRRCRPGTSRSEVLTWRRSWSWPSARTGRARRSCAGWPVWRRRSRALLRHAADRRVVHAGSRARGGGPADPLPGARRVAASSASAGLYGAGRPVVTAAASTATGTASRTRGAGGPDRGDRRRQEGDRHPRARPARDGRYTDFFVICSGNTERQTKAIHDADLRGLKDDDGPAAAPRRGRSRGALDPDGLPRLRGAHLHARGARVYRLEKLWGEAPTREVG